MQKIAMLQTNFANVSQVGIVIALLTLLRITNIDYANTY
ncbi:hypothetical protein PPRY_a1467 [Pseudoalteromonas prydzensis ACAM 620]|nr:hypothetical protein [Pseudoalteromonas prydzensis ACAM 620]